MNTYNIQVNGVEVVAQVPQEELQKNLNVVRGLVWTSGGSDKDIEVILNTSENTLQ
jgi:hypothetical protein